MKPVFTVFTPTYNRAHTLPRVWKSLQQQTFRDFEWLIVDDGSSDNTAEVVAGFQAASEFPIVYLQQQHGHKKAASNLAVRNARGTLFLTLDSDDECLPNALERFYYYWNSIPELDREKFSAVTALCCYEDGSLVGDPFPVSQGQNYLDSDSIEIVHKYKLRGEKWGFQRTDVMRVHPFPDIEGFVPEGVVWTQIALHYKTRFVNEVLRIYHQSPDSLTQRSGPRKESAKGTAYWMDSVFQNEVQYFRYNPKWFVRCAINFTRFHLHAGDSPISRSLVFPRSTTALLMAACPLGRLAYFMDRRKEKKNGTSTN